MRKLDPSQLQQNAKEKRERLEAEKIANREYKENAIFRGPEVAVVAAAAKTVKNEADFICAQTCEAMENAIAELREERDQLRVRLERINRAMNDDIARAEGELHWIDYASAETKKMIDEADAQRERDEREKKKKDQKKPEWK